jgi:hypothetical protein
MVSAMELQSLLLGRERERIAHYEAEHEAVAGARSGLIEPHSMAAPSLRIRRCWPKLWQSKG